MVDILLKRLYGLNALKIEKSVVGAGSDTYFADCAEGKFVVKFPSVSEMNNPETEPKLCEFLLEKGVNVCEFIRNKDGNFLSADDFGRVFHVQKFIDGKVYDMNTAPDWLLLKSAEMLGKIHTALKAYEGLPVGIGADFFRFMTPENALHSYENSLRIARENGDREIEADLLYRIGLMKNFPKYQFEIEKLTCANTHGDYFISQLICGEDRINAVIDWTTACVHPAVWEVVRSYAYAAPECADGVINAEKLADYFKAYLRFSSLNKYDIEAAASLFYYQISVCDYYGQYYSSAADNREIYLHQAVFSTRLMKWFEHNIGGITEDLLNISDR
ncbi:MAG: aminoglycoside phosphotransferase family protein [Oscillospiraceae bacterium]|nr:aminoglycoside phosphotransferase family protein [Oscillospiraceae bacterium]